MDLFSLLYQENVQTALKAGNGPASEVPLWLLQVDGQASILATHVLVCQWKKPPQQSELCDTEERYILKAQRTAAGVS